LQRLAVDFIGSENLPLKSPAGPLQAPTKPTREEDPEKKRRTDFGQTGEEDGTGRRQQIQTGGFTPFSARRCQRYWFDLKKCLKRSSGAFYEPHIWPADSLDYAAAIN
jgi:hypothetical protein